MLINEAKWIWEQCERLDVQALSPMLNIGSATLEFREFVQPWINDFVFDPLRQRGVEVNHLDMLPGEGVDIVGDITNPKVINYLSRRRYRSVICTNLLEHVSDVRPICATIEAIVAPGGYIIMTVPKRFPFHPDPIDTMFRPDVTQLLGLFLQSRCVEGAVVNCGTFWNYVGHTFLVTVPWGMRHSSGFDKWILLRAVGGFLASIFKSSQVTCLLMKRELPGG